MFQFPGFAFVTLCIQAQIPSLDNRKSETGCPQITSKPCGLEVPVIEGGFPHSEICGSKVVRTSPQLIAAYHVLHRLSAPRHPPNTLKALDRSHYQHPPLGRGRITFAIRGCDRKTICFKHIREHRGQALFTTGSPSSRTIAKPDPPHECR